MTAPVLTVEQLAHFATPKTWPEILVLEPRLTRFGWVNGIVDADERGFGLLGWSPALSGDRGTWRLTAKGRAYVAAHPPRTNTTDESLDAH